MRGILSIVLCMVAALGAFGCRTSGLKKGAENVSAGRNPPPPGCKSLGYLTGRGGGTFGGAYISNESLIEYALNDLRNQAAALGANYIQHDPPQLGGGDGTTTTATMTGTAYQCPKGTPIETAAGSTPAQPAGAKAETGAPAPTGAVGFEFGQAVEKAASICKNAGFEWAPTTAADTNTCSGTPVDVGVKASVTVRDCAGRVCDVSLTSPQTGTATESERTLQTLEAALSKKYGQGKPLRILPAECAGDALDACYKDGRARSSMRWEWSSGQRIVIGLERSATVADSMALVLKYSSQPTTVSKANGL